PLGLGQCRGDDVCRHAIELFGERTRHRRPEGGELAVRHPPESSASDRSVSSSLNRSPSSPGLNSTSHPLCLKSPTVPGTGPSMTPSSDTCSVTTILPISWSSLLTGAPHHGDVSAEPDSAGA